MLHGCSNKEMNKSRWRNESRKEQISRKKVDVTVCLDKGIIIIDKESYTEWKERWKKLKKILNKGQKRNKQQRLAEKEV